MLISLIFFYSVVEFTFVNSVRSNWGRTSALTELHRFNNQVLKRRIRSLVFPNNAQLLFTPAVSKAVLDGRPRGLNFVLELNTAHPLPGNIEGWKPTILLNKFKDKVTTSKPLKTSLPQTRKDSGSHNQNFIDLAEDATVPYLLYDNYNFPFHGGKGRNDFNLEWKPRTMNSSNRNFGIDSNQIHGYASHFHKLPRYRIKYKRDKNFSSNWHKTFASHDSFVEEESVHDFQSDREREQIHKQFEVLGKVFKINMKKCMQRAVCELDSHLRTQGESLMEDIIRIILIPSFPSNTPLDRANISNIYCKKKFAVSCPYNILDSLAKLFNVNI